MNNHTNNNTILFTKQLDNKKIQLSDYGYLVIEPNTEMHIDLLDSKLVYVNGNENENMKIKNILDPKVNYNIHIKQNNNMSKKEHMDVTAFLIYLVIILIIYNIII